MVGVGWLRGIAVPVVVQDDRSTYIAARPTTSAMQIFHKLKCDWRREVSYGRYKPQVDSGCGEWLASVQTDKLGRSSLLLQLLYLSHTDSLRDADICHLAHPPLPESNCRVRLPWRGLVTGVCARGGGKLVECYRNHTTTRIRIIVKKT